MTPPADGNVRQLRETDVTPLERRNAGSGDARAATAKAPAPSTTPAADAQPAEVKAASTQDTKPAGGKRRRIFLGIGLVVVAAAGWLGHDYWTVGRFITSTDDAYVAGNIAAVSSKLPGYVAAVNVSANQRVKAGDPLVTLDDGDYRIAADQARAQIATQKLTLQRYDAQIAGAGAGVAQARAQKAAAEATQRNAAVAQQRATQLLATSTGTQAAVDAANAALGQANANVAAADAQIASAEAAASVLRAQRAEAESQLATLTLALDKAERDLGFTVLRAPYDGIVGNLAVQTGNLVSAGQRLAALVPADALYVDANFKETQLADLAIGEKATVAIDANGGKRIEGTIASIAPASGSVFSLLPAENATGNFTKVVQRVAVRIALPKDALDAGYLRAGLSVVVRADARTFPAAR